MDRNQDKIAILKQFVRQSDPKQAALVGMQALTILAGKMTGRELSAFLHDASAEAEKAHVESLRGGLPRQEPRLVRPPTRGVPPAAIARRG